MPGKPSGVGKVVKSPIRCDINSESNPRSKESEKLASRKQNPRGTDLPAFLRSQDDGQADWKSQRQDLYRCGLEGRALQWILPHGLRRIGGDSHSFSAGAASALLGTQDVQSSRGPQVRLRPGQARSASHRSGRDPSAGRSAFRRFGNRWRGRYPDVVKRLGQDLLKCFRPSHFHATCGANCAPPTSSRLLRRRASPYSPDGPS